MRLIKRGKFLGIIPIWMVTVLGGLVAGLYVAFNMEDSIPAKVRSMVDKGGQ
jgi:hypothetical protein